MVNESAGTIDLCITKNRQTIGDVTLEVQHTDDTAFGNRIYYAV